MNDSRCIARVLNHGPRVTAASPGYLTTHGEPQTPAGSLQHNCIMSNFSPVLAVSTTAADIASICAVRGNLVVTGGDALREGVLLGLGIAQSNWWTLRHDLAVGTLKPCWKPSPSKDAPSASSIRRRGTCRSKLRVMIDFLVEITRLPAAVERDLEAPPAESLMTEAMIGADRACRAAALRQPRPRSPPCHYERTATSELTTNSFFLRLISSEPGL